MMRSMYRRSMLINPSTPLHTATLSSSCVSASTQIDFSRQSESYSNHRPGFPPSFYQRITSLISQHFKRSPSLQWNHLNVLDLGTGPGIVALEIAQLGGNVVGIDIAQGQIDAAIIAAKKQKLESKCQFVVGKAEDTKLEAHSFDVIIAAQCWWWLDPTRTMKEIHRLLKPNGLLIVCCFCYLPTRSKLAHESEELVLKVNPKWTMAGTTGIFPEMIDQLVIDGQFNFVEQFCYDHLQYFTHEAWRGRMLTCNGVGANKYLSKKLIDEYDEMLKKHLQDKYSKEDPVGVWHRIWTVVVSTSEIREKLQSSL